MGQAAVDLPDPSQVPAAPIVSADDLLSQMAGDEIDRLLAEAEVEKGGASPDGASADAREENLPIQATEAELDELLQQISSEPDDLPKPETAAQPASDSAAVAELAAAMADPGTAAKELDQALATASVDALPEVKPPETETSPAEKSALAEVSDALDTAGPDSEEIDQPVPIYLKPLVWLNAPMMLLPPVARDALGKVAILTLVNAVAVFIYVLVFRKH